MTLANRYCWYFLLIIAMWIGFITLHDEPIDEGFEAFYSRILVPNEDNAAIGLSGLQAPHGQDFIKFGLSTSQKIYSSKKLPETNNHIIEFVGSKEELACWSGYPQNEKDASLCASEERLKILFKENAELLARYRQVLQLHHLSGLTWAAEPFLRLNRLIAAEVDTNLRHGRYEAAYQVWRDNYQFLSLGIGADTGLLDKVIFAVAEAASLGSVKSLIHSYPGIAEKHGDEMLKLLTPSGLARWNLPGLMRAEYFMFDSILTPGTTKFWVHRNFIRNRFYRLAQAVLRASTQPPDIVEEKVNAIMNEFCNFKTWDIDYLRDPMNAIFVKSMIGGQLKTGDVFTFWHRRDGDLRVLTLAVMIKKQRIADEKIDDFLAAVGPELKDPFTHLPMHWDPIKRAIRFEAPKSDYTFEVHL